MAVKFNKFPVSEENFQHTTIKLILVDSTFADNLHKLAFAA